MKHLDEGGEKYAILVPAYENLERGFAERLPCPMGTPKRAEVKPKGGDSELRLTRYGGREYHRAQMRNGQIMNS